MDSVVEKFPYKCQFYLFQNNCWQNSCCVCSSWTLKKRKVVLDSPTEEDQTNWTYEDYFKSWYNAQSRQVINPKEAMKKLVKLLILHEKDKLSSLSEKRRSLMEKQQHVETFLELVQKVEVFKRLIPEMVDVIKYDKCRCGHQREDVQANPVDVPVLALRSIRDSNDTVCKLLCEELVKQLMTNCENCGQEIKSEISRVFFQPTDGFVVCVNRGKWTECVDENGAPLVNANGTPVVREVRNKIANWN